MKSTTLRSAAGRVAVAGTAAIAALLPLAQPAFADDDLAPDVQTGESTTPETPTSTPVETEAPVQTETPVEDVPADETPQPEAPVESETPAEETPEAAAPTPSTGVDTIEPAVDLVNRVLAEPVDEEPAYVAQSFTVGAAIADGSYFSAALGDVTTAGTTFNITITSADRELLLDTDCTTGAPGSGTTTFCSDPSSGPFLARGIDGDIEIDLPAGAIAGITVIGVPEGFTLSYETKFVRPTEEVPTGPSDQVFRLKGLVPTVSNEYLDPVYSGDEPSIIDVLGGEGYGDTVGDPNTTLEVRNQPSRGTITAVNPSAIDPRTRLRAAEAPDHAYLVFTPNGSEVGGLQQFSYVATNSNGSSEEILMTMEVASAEGEVQPVFGSQKYRVGVQVDSGAYIPAGVSTTTVGSKFTIVRKNQAGVVTDTSSCVSTAPAPIPVPIPAGDSECGDVIGGYDETAPGETVTVTQTAVPPTMTQYLRPGAPVTIPACDTNVAPCGDFPVTASIDVLGATLPEDIVDDNDAETQKNTPVLIDVLANDRSDDPVKADLSVETQPGHGTATVEGDPAVPATTGRMAAAAIPAAGDQQVRYTPAADFTGTDSFTYGVTNRNGTSTATVTVEVLDGEVVPPTDPTDPDPTDPGTTDPGDTTGSDDGVAAGDSALPDTGGLDGRWLGLGALLTAAGAFVLGRRRRDVRG